MNRRGRNLTNWNSILKPGVHKSKVRVSLQSGGRPGFFLSLRALILMEDHVKLIKEASDIFSCKKGYQTLLSQ